MTKPFPFLIALCLLVLAGCSPVGALASPTGLPSAIPSSTVVTAEIPAATVIPTNAPTSSPVPAETPTAQAATSEPVQAASITLTWYGQAAFLLTTSTGLRALMDPAGPGTGYTIPQLDAIDVVTVSHEHSDHSYVSLAAGSPLILRGLAGSGWASIDQTVKGVRIRSVGVYHDEDKGSQRGRNAIFIFDIWTCTACKHGLHRGYIAFRGCC